MKNIQTQYSTKFSSELGSLTWGGVILDCHSKVWEGNLSSVSGSHSSALVFIGIVREAVGDT